MSQERKRRFPLPKEVEISEKMKGWEERYSLDQVFHEDWQAVLSHYTIKTSCMPLA